MLPHLFDWLRWPRSTVPSFFESGRKKSLSSEPRLPQLFSLSRLLSCRTALFRVCAARSVVLPRLKARAHMEAGGVACVAPSSALLADGGIVERTTEKAMSKEITRPPNSQPPPVSFARESAKEASARAPTDDDDFASILLGLSTSVVTPSSSSSPSFLQPRSVGSNLGAGGVASSRSPSLKSTATKSDRIPRSSSTPSLRDREEASSASSSPASSNVSSPPPSSPASRASSFSSPAPPQRSRETMRQAREEMATLLRVVSQNPRKLLDWERASQLLRGCVQRVKELLGKEYEDEHALRYSH